MHNTLFKFVASVCVGLFVLQPCGLSKLTAADRTALIQKSIDKGVVYLKKNLPSAGLGQDTLGAYALYKAGVPATSPEVAAVIAKVRAKVKDGKYTEGGHKIYTAGVDAMLLADTGKEKYVPEIKVIIQYLIDEQKEEGGWNYRDVETGDTSVTQYALLAFWAAARVGIEVPGEVLDKAAAWHVRTQQRGGAFVYMPGTKEGEASGNPTLSLSAGGSGSVMVCRLLLYPDAVAAEFEKKEKKKENPNGKKFGLLKKVEVPDATSPKNMDKSKQTISGNYKPQTKLSDLDDAAKRGIGWLNGNFRPMNKSAHRMYYYYSMERTMALADVEELRGQDWFDVCAAAVLSLQDKDGGWATHTSKQVGTSFALLFLTRSTAKLLGRPVGPKVPPGLLAGGRGLPDDLNKARMNKGKLEEEKSKDPLAELLKELEKPGSVFDESLQESIVEKIQLGDPEQLIGQYDRIVKLVDNPQPDVRRTALWALARSGKIKDAKLMIDRIKEDNDIDVLVEARNALCFLSHKPTGFGYPENPIEDLPETATAAQKNAAVKKWKDKVFTKWARWYIGVRPYDSKNDLWESTVRSK